MADVKLLDCTLRDGGYINNWKWGYRKSKDIIEYLVKAQVDIVEVGFLRNVKEYDKNVTVCNKVEELNKLLPETKGKTMFSAMAMRSNYDVSKLSYYNGEGIEMIRVTAHDYDLAEGLEFAASVKRKGYKVSINPINVMGYSDEQLIWICKKVNEILPYQFSIVDTFGSMRRRDLDRIVSIVDHNLNRSIRLGLHLHENMALSFYLAQSFIDKNIQRDYTIDGSLMGMGRVPGNLPLELIADYVNEYCDKKYDINYMMDAIQDYIAPIREQNEWGYSPAYFLSAKYNLHRNYAEHYIDKDNLTIRDINNLLSRIDKEKTTVFDAKYADDLYTNYLENTVDDSNAKMKLSEKLMGHDILVIAPGNTINTQQVLIHDFIKSSNVKIISLNFIPEEYNPDFAFFSNRKRYDKVNFDKDRIIVTSNLDSEGIEFVIDYNSLASIERDENNSLIFLIKLLEELGVKNVYLAGADGFVHDEKNYYDTSIVNNKVKDISYNKNVANIIKGSRLKINFITKSEYQKYID